MIEKALLAPVYINGKNQTLAELYISFNKIRNGWKDKSNLRNIQYLPNPDRSKFTLQQDSILGEFHRKLIANALTVDKLDKKLSIIMVRVKSENELFSKYFAEVLVKEVSDFYVETKTKKSVQNLAILQRQTDSVRRALNYAIGGVASSVDANPNVNPARQFLAVPTKRRQVDVQANQAILTELVKNLEISKISLRKETPLIQIIDKPVLPLVKEKFGVLKGILIGLLLAGGSVVLALIAARIIKNVIAQI